MPYPQQTFSSITDLLAYINSEVVTNGNQEITAIVENNVENSLANFIVKYTLNSGLAGISSSTAVTSLSKPIVVFTVAPTSVSWPDNLQNEYYIVNATGTNIPLTSGYTYTDAYQTTQITIPARTAIHIAKATNGSWIQINNIGGGNTGSLPPQTGHAGEFLNTSGTTPQWFSPCMFITSADFEADGITYINTNLVTSKFLLFWNDIPRFIYNVDENPSNIEWQYQSGGGLKILIPGFNANTSDYHLYLFLKGLNT